MKSDSILSILVLLCLVSGPRFAIAKCFPVNGPIDKILSKEMNPDGTCKFKVSKVGFSGSRVFNATGSSEVCSEKNLSEAFLVSSGGCRDYGKSREQLKNQNTTTFVLFKNREAYKKNYKPLVDHFKQTFKKFDESKEK
jgi:hypothetical protein